MRLLFLASMACIYLPFFTIVDFVLLVKVFFASDYFSSDHDPVLWGSKMRCSAKHSVSFVTQILLQKCISLRYFCYRYSVLPDLVCSWYSQTIQPGHFAAATPRSEDSLARDEDCRTAQERARCTQWASRGQSLHGEPWNWQKVKFRDGLIFVFECKIAVKKCWL